MSRAQILRLHAYLIEKRPMIFSHGACVGADNEADLVAVNLGIYRIIYPATNAEKRVTDTTLKDRGPVLIHPAKPPLDRNKDIVRAGDLLIACPKEQKEIIRSGTWTTVRYARRIGRPFIVIDP